MDFCKGWRPFKIGQCAVLVVLSALFVASCSDSENRVSPTACGAKSGCESSEFCQTELGACGDLSRGECIELPEACTLEFDPVCSCSGQTFANPCAAAAQGESIAERGPCE